VSKLVFDSLKLTFKSVKWLMHSRDNKEDIGARLASGSEQSEIINSSNKGLLIDGDKKRLSLKDSFLNIGVFAGQGAGKSAGIIIPNILDKSKSKCSMLISDCSGEIYQQTSGALKAKGFDIFVYDPTNPKNNFNPFHGLDHRDIDDITGICQSLVLSKYGSSPDQFWNEGALVIFETLAKCLAYNMPAYLNLPNLNYLINKFGSDGSSLDSWVAENSLNPFDPDDTTLLDSWKNIIGTEPKVLNSQLSVLRTVFKPFNNSNFQTMLFSNDFDPQKIRKKKTVIYLKIKENKFEQYKFFLDLFYSRFFSTVMERLPDKSDLDVFCFLDEFGHSYIHGLATIMNNIRKYRVSLLMIFQSSSQIANKYGKELSQTIRSAISHNIIFGGIDPITGKEQSDKIGKKVLRQSKTLGDPIDQYTQLDLVSPEQIRTLNDNQILFISRNRPAFILKYTKHFERNSRFRSLAKKKPYDFVGSTTRVVSNRINVS